LSFILLVHIETTEPNRSCYSISGCEEG